MRILVIEDSELDYEMLVATLAMQGVHASSERVESERELRSALVRRTWDLVISDHQLPGFSSDLALAVVRELPAPPPFIIVSGVIGEEAAVEAMRCGADDYLIKGRLVRLGMAVRNAVAAARARRAKAHAEEQLQRSQEQLRNLSIRLQTVLEDERAAIARDIHDEIGGTLTAVKYDLDSLQKYVDEDHAPRLVRAKSALAQASAASQRILRDLRPPVLDAGLVPALEWLMRQFHERTAIPVEFECNAPDTVLDTHAAMALYRACQESLTNIVKHAQAQRVFVDLHFGGAVVSLEVSDDGRGFDEAALTQPASLGLRGLAERARAQAGGLEVSRDHGRTTVMLWLPRRGHAECLDTQPAELAA